MAEFAIPLVALGGLYLIGNQSKKAKENFQSKGAKALPNTDLPNRNFPSEYPILSPADDLTSSLSANNAYDGRNVYTDKFFNPNSKDSLLGASAADPPKAGEATYYSLTGEKVSGSYFQHNNMAPFFGSKMRGQHKDANSYESLLDSYTGQGSQTIRKQERAPLFKPDENFHFPHGAPNNSDFYQSRVNPSLKMSNVNPFAEEKVGPGIGAGYGTEGVGGYNSGLLSRDLYLDRNVDELRTANKPKAGGIGILGYEGPANARVQNRGDIGIQNKNRVERDFELGRDRLFTTMGASTAPTARAEIIERHVNRPDTTVSYTGVAGACNTGEKLIGEYMPSTNIELGAVPLAPAYHVGFKGANEGDYGHKSTMVYQNNRSANQQDTYFGAFGGAIGAVVAPLLDALRPSRRENTVGTLRPYQNAKSTVANSYVLNPNDRPQTTIRETTELGTGHLFVNGTQSSDAYKVTAHQPIMNNRMSQSDFYYAGVGSAGERGRQPRAYDAEYNQRNNDLKSSTLAGFTPAPGRMNMMNNDINMSAKDKNYYLENRRQVVPTMPYQNASIEAMGRQSVSETQNLYSGMQLDRSNADILTQLKGNPYALNHINGL